MPRPAAAPTRSPRRRPRAEALTAAPAPARSPSAPRPTTPTRSSPSCAPRSSRPRASPWTGSTRSVSARCTCPSSKAGSLDLLPEYLGNLLQHYDSEAASASPEEIHGALGEVLPAGLRVLAFAEASDQDSYTTTSEFASTHSLTAIGDLAGVDEDLRIAANSEFDVRPYGPEGAKEVYDVDVTVVPVEDSGGPLTVQSLLDGDVQLADIYTADPAIAENDLVVLADPESMILPQNVVPVVSEKVDETAATAIEGVIAQLSADDLVELNRQSVVDQASSADIASGWLTEKGLL